MDELDKLVQERENLNKKIEEVYRDARLKALTTCRELIKKYKLLPAELGLKKLMKKGAATPKYMGPNGQTWAGRGRKPVWLQEAELEGKTAEDFKISLPDQTEKDKEADSEEVSGLEYKPTEG